MIRRRHVDRPAFGTLSLRLSRSDNHPRLDDGQSPLGRAHRGR